MKTINSRTSTVLALLGAATAMFTLHTLVSADKAVIVKADHFDLPECSDGIDNNGENGIDFPHDPECEDLHDDSEGFNHGLFIALYDGVDKAKAGDSLTYTVELRSEREERRNVEVRVLLPHQMNLVTASNGGVKEGTEVVWRNVHLSPGVTRKLNLSLQISPHAKEGLLIITEARAHGQVATDATTVTEAVLADHRALTISVDDGKVFAEPNEELTYRIVVDNSRGSAATDYTLRSQLPAGLNFVAAKGNPTVNTRKLTWPQYRIEAGEVHEFLLTAYLDREIQDLVAVRLRVYANEALGSDTTSIHTGADQSALRVSITDGLESIGVGQEITYNIRVNNPTDLLATEIEVSNAIPTYTEFVSASEGGTWTGNNVRWKGLTIAPHGERTLQVTARVRSDAPMNAELLSRLDVLGHKTLDRTYVGNGVVRSSNLVASTADLRQPVLLRKVASRSEVQPGGVLNYTLYLKNTTDKPFTNVLVEDRMDAKYLRVANPENGNWDGSRITWSIPVLEAGQEWTARYSVQVSPHVPHGTTLTNVATVSGEGLETFSLTDRVSTNELGVVSTMPATGAAADALFLMLTGLLTLGGVNSRKLLSLV